jgi:hypothetical protein
MANSAPHSHDHHDRDPGHDHSHEHDHDGLEFGDGHEDEDQSALIKESFGLPDTLPPIRLPSDAELAEQVRSVPLVKQLAALAEWVGADGRDADEDGELTGDARDEALRILNVPADRFRYLWKYATAVDWVEVDEDGQARGGQTAEAWGDGTDDEGVLEAWAATFAAILSESMCAAAEGSDDFPANADIHGPAMPLAMLLFLSRPHGLTREEVSLFIKQGATAEHPAEQGAWDSWASAHGDPAGVLIDELAAVQAITPPDIDEDEIRLAPLALREIRLQLTDADVEIPLLPATAAELTAEQLLTMAPSVFPEEFESESAAWLAAHGTDQSAQSAGELLDLAADGDPSTRITAMSVVSQLGPAAEQAWRDRIDVVSLRPYVKTALAALAIGVPSVAPGQGGLMPDLGDLDKIPDELRPTPEDVTWVTIDTLWLSCEDEDTDPEHLGAMFDETVPADRREMIFNEMWRSPHPEAERVLDHLGTHHPNKKIAKEARRAAFRATTSRGTKKH